MATPAAATSSVPGAPLILTAPASFPDETAETMKRLWANVKPSEDKLPTLRKIADVKVIEPLLNLLTVALQCLRAHEAKSNAKQARSEVAAAMGDAPDVAKLQELYRVTKQELAANKALVEANAAFAEALQVQELLGEGTKAKPVVKVFLLRPHLFIAPLLTAQHQAVLENTKLEDTVKDLQLRACGKFWETIAPFVQVERETLKENGNLSLRHFYNFNALKAKEEAVDLMSKLHAAGKLYNLLMDVRAFARAVREVVRPTMESIVILKSRAHDIKSAALTWLGESSPSSSLKRHTLPEKGKNTQQAAQEWRSKIVEEFNHEVRSLRRIETDLDIEALATQFRTAFNQDPPPSFQELGRLLAAFDKRESANGWLVAEKPEYIMLDTDGEARLKTMLDRTHADILLSYESRREALKKDFHETILAAWKKEAKEEISQRVSTISGQITRLNEALKTPFLPDVEKCEEAHRASLDKDKLSIQLTGPAVPGDPVPFSEPFKPLAASFRELDASLAGFTQEPAKDWIAQDSTFQQELKRAQTALFQAHEETRRAWITQRGEIYKTLWTWGVALNRLEFAYTHGYFPKRAVHDNVQLSLNAARLARYCTTYTSLLIAPPPAQASPQPESSATPPAPAAAGSIVTKETKD